MQSAKTPDEQLAFLKALNKTLNIPSMVQGHDWTEIVGIIANWTEEHSNKPTDAISAEIINLILVCLTKMPMTSEILIQTNVFSTIYQHFKGAKCYKSYRITSTNFTYFD